MYLCICFIRWDNKTHSWIKRKYPLEEDPAKAKMFVRVYTVSPRKQELFAIRYNNFQLILFYSCALYLFS